MAAGHSWPSSVKSMGWLLPEAGGQGTGLMDDAEPGGLLWVAGLELQPQGRSQCALVRLKKNFPLFLLCLTHT